jgi:predicted nucleic acid-binding protein
LTVRRVFCDTGILVRYFADDDPPRALAAARLIDGDDTLVVSTAVLIEVAHVLRTQHGRGNPDIADALVAFLTKRGVELSDADQAQVVAALQWSARVSARRIPDALISAAAERARCDLIATFDERMTALAVPVRML